MVTMSSVSVEEILAKFLETNSESAKTAKAELKEAMKRPTICPTLLHIGKNSTSPPIRQYALFFLQKRLSKFDHWDQLTVDVKHGIKSGLLDALTQETDVSLCNTTAKVVASVAKHELANGKWPELLKFIQELCCQAKTNKKELGFYILSIVADSASEELKIFLKTFVVIFHSALQDSDTISACYACVAFKKLIPCMGTDEAIMIQPLIPKILIIVRNAIVIDEVKTMSWITDNLMEIWEKLLMGRTAILAPHLKAVTELCMEIASNKELNDFIRNKALSCISTLARLEKKSMIENKLISPILQTLFVLMTEEEEEEEDDDDNDQSPCHVAAETLSNMALHLPSDKIITPLLQWADPVFKGSDIRAQQAGYTALAVVAEGCAEHIRTEYMAQFVQFICSGIKHPQAHVRSAAQHAVGQFSEHLLPDIVKYANDILPILLENLSATVNSLASGKKVPRSMYRLFYALTMFCHALGAKLNPFVPALMENVIIALNPAYPLLLKTCALFALGITAFAVQKAMVPYLGRIMENLKIYLSGQLTEEEMPLQINALDTLSVIAQTIGEQTFRPFADECLNLTINLVQSKDDPNLRKSAYEVFASLACVMKEDTAAALPVIIPLLMKTVESNEGVTAATTDDDESAFPAGDLLDDDEDVIDSEDDDECDVAGDTVENDYLLEKDKACLQEEENANLQEKKNTYLQEKKEACATLSELALKARGSFTSYVEQCTGPVYKLVDCGPCCYVHHNYNNHEVIYSAALSALTQFTICIGKQSNGEKACLAALSVLIPKLSEAIRTDRRFEVVSDALDCLTYLLKELKDVGSKSEAHLDTLYMTMKNVFNKATECQAMERTKEGDDDEETDMEDTDSEACVELLEDAGYVLAAFGNAMTPQEFAPYFAELLPVILHSAREHCKIAEKSVCASVLAKCMEPLDGVLEPFVPDLFTTFSNLVRDSDSEVRTNSVFGLGELVLHGRELLFPNFPQILQILSDALSRETNPLALDNICIAFTRMIIVNISAVPMDQVFPALISHLPLREKCQQNSLVLKMLFILSNGHPVFASHFPQVMNVILTMATQQELQPEQKPMIKELVGHIESRFSGLFYEWAFAIPIEWMPKLTDFLL